MPISLGKLLEQHIEPDHRVAFIGSYLTAFHDPSALFGSSITSQGRGRTWIVDFQSHSLKNAIAGIDLEKRSSYQKSLLDKLRGISSKGSGVGDPVLYRKSVKMIAKKFGLKLKPPYHMVADAVNMDFKDKELNVLVDAGTASFVQRGKNHGADNLLKEYKRVAKKVILIGHPEDLKKLKFKLMNIGAKNVDFLEVENEYLLKTGLPGSNAEVAKPERATDTLAFHFFAQALNSMPKTKVLNLSHTYCYNRALVAEF